MKNTALNEMSRSVPTRLRHIEQTAEPEHRETNVKKSSSRSSSAVVLVNSLQLWFSAEDLCKLGPVNVPPWMEERS